MFGARFMMSIARGSVIVTFLSCSSPTNVPIDAQSDSHKDASTDLLLRVPLDGQPCIEAQLDGKSALLVVDTGAIRTAVDKTLLHNVENGVGFATIDFGNGNVLRDYEVLAADLATARDHIGAPIAGLIGQDLVNRFAFGIDYRNGRAYVTDGTQSPVPSDVASIGAIAVPYEVMQGLPIVTARIGDTSVRLLADTGSGVTLITKSKAPEAALALGLQGYVWYTSYGSDPATIIRLPSIDVANHAVKQTWAVVVPDAHHLASVFKSLKIEIDGFLGYPVYREFFVAVRGAERRFDFYPYASRDPRALSEWNRIGIETYRSGASVLIDMVFTPSDAANKGVLRGDRVNTIDDVPVAALELDDVRARLRGAVGDKRRLGIIREGVAQTIDVQVDGLLP